MRDKERGVSFYDLAVESRLHGEKNLIPAAVPVADALALAYETTYGKPYSFGTGAVKITIADWVQDKAKRDHYLVINRADASLDDIPLRNLDTGAVRMAGKQKREGIDLSCHVLIRESADPKKPALLLLTNGSSLTTDRLAKNLGTLFRQARTRPGNERHFERPHPNGVRGKTLQMLSSFTLAGHQNATLENILKGGTLQGIELMTENVPTFDGANPLGLTEIQYRLEPIAQKPIFLTTIKNAIKNLVGETGDEPTKARVRYKPPGTEKSETHTFENVAALEAAFVRRDMIRFAAPIAPRYVRVEMRVMNELINLANREKI